LTAAQRYTAALELTTDTTVAAANVRAWLHVRLAIMRCYVNPQQSLIDLDEATREHAHRADPLLAVAILLVRSIIRCLIGDFRGGLEEMGKAVTALNALSDVEKVQLRDIPELTRMADSIRGYFAYWLSVAGRYAEAEEMATAARTSYLIEDATGSRSTAYCALLHVNAALGKPEEARQAFIAARDMFSAMSFYSMMYINYGDYLNMVMLPYATDDRVGRRQIADAAERAYTQATGAVGKDSSSLGHFKLLFLEGKWEELQRMPLDNHPTTDAQFPLATVIMGLLAHIQGAQAAAWERIRAILPLGSATAPGGVNVFAALEAQRLAIALALDASDLPTAHEWLEMHERWLTWSGGVLGGSEGHSLRSEYHCAAGNTEKAYEHAHSALDLATNPRQPLALLIAHRHLGTLDTKAGRYAEAMQHFEQALTLAAACATPYERARTLLAMVECYFATERSDMAHSALDEARVISMRLGATSMVEHIDMLSTRV
jgi:hypothetical protein